LGRIAGPMTASVEDAALLMNALARPDARDFMCLPHQETDYAHELDALQIGRLKIGFLPDMKCGLPVHAEVRGAAEAAANALRTAGAQVEEMASFLTPEMLDGTARFFEARSHNDFMALPREQQARVLPFIAEWCTWRASSFTGRDVMQAYNMIMAMREAAVRACQRFDYVLSPTSPITAYEADLPAPGNNPR